jgi:serine/threonine-protein kinase
LDGDVQHQGDTVRVTLRLRRSGSIAVGWSETFDGSLSDVFALQNAIANVVTERLNVAGSPTERQRLRKVPTRDIEAWADYTQARTFLDRKDVEGNLERSINLFESAIKKDPKFAWAHAGLGEAQWLLYRHTLDVASSARASQEAAEALRLDRDDPLVRTAVARIYKDVGRREDAIEELRAALVLQPANDEAHEYLGLTIAETGHLDEGISEIQTAITLRPNYWGHYYALGYVYLTAGRHREAVNAFRRLTELQPDNALGLSLLGAAHDHLGEREQAKSDYERSIRIAPNAPAYSNLGLIHYREGKYREAAHAFEEALRLDPNTDLRHRNLGDAYQRLGQATRALGCYRRAAELAREKLRTNPRDTDTMAKLAVYEAKLRHWAEADRLTREALAKGPASGAVLYRVAVVNALAGRSGESVAFLERALQQGYSMTFAREDDDLAGLRSNPTYKRLLAQP